MRGEPPEHLVNLLGQWNLATPAQIHSVAPRVRRLAADLPDFESVWVDALSQARVLTPLQAAEINAGRGAALVCGPYVILQRLASPAYAECFAGRHLDGGRIVRLYRVRRLQVTPAVAARALAQLVEQLAPLAGPVSSVAEDSGILSDGVWAACPAIAGTTAAEWLAENGRLAPALVLHIAREMLQRLADLELLNAVHGDVGAAGLVMQSSGHVVLPMPGLRGAVRPSEGYGFNDLPGEAYDYLAPERVADGIPPTIASDLYGCGCLWWHLLTGRPPLPGGNSLAKLKSAHAARVIDVRQLAPDVPDVLARAIEMCLARDPAARPASSGELGEFLGPPARGGHAILSRSLAGQPWLWQTSRRPRSTGKIGYKRALAGASAVVLVCAMTAGLWLARRHGESPAHDADATAIAAAPADPSAGRLRARPLGEDEEKAHGGATHIDRQVTQTSALEPADRAGPDDLVLPADKKIPAGTLAFKPGQRVRGRGGKRPVISVSEAGLTVPCDDVCFEGVDFVWEATAADESRARQEPAMITVNARSVTLRRCSFSTATDATPIAIAWSGADEGGGGEITCSDCVFQGLAAVVDCRGDGGVAVELANTLCVAAGPIVRLHGCPRAGQRVAISLVHTTTRGDSAVLECRYGRLETEPGEIAITVSDSALVTNPRGGLLVFSGAERPDALLKAISWNGQGSLVTPDTAVALWRAHGDKAQVLAEDELEIAGLVRSQVDFAGSAAGPPAGSRITRWQVPLRSADPPGANVNSLVVPSH